MTEQRSWVTGEGVPEERDPRPDLEADSAQWDRLLRCAVTEDAGDPYGPLGALRGVRSCGARIEMAAGRFRLVPGPGYAGNWEDDRDRWLVPHRADVARWLREVADCGGGSR